MSKKISKEKNLLQKLQKQNSAEFIKQRLEINKQV